MIIIAFFNNKGGVGKTSLAYHLAWMFTDLGARVVAADLDPQANLTAAFLDEESLEPLWIANDRSETIYSAVRPLLSGTGDVLEPTGHSIHDRLVLLAGDLALSAFEDELSSEWSGCLDRKERSFRVITAFWRVLEALGSRISADLAVVDLGPNLGAINRAALIAADFIVMPLSPDLFSLQGLRNLGPTLDRWRDEWAERRKKNPAPSLAMPRGEMRAAGYVVLQHAVRLDRPVRAYARWLDRIPREYRESVLREAPPVSSPSVSNDPHCLALLKHYRSLMPMAQEARKPVFHLRPADGAIGAHSQAVLEAGGHFEALARRIADRCGLPLPQVPV